MTEIVVVRAKPNLVNREDQFLGGVASIGWPDTGDLAGADRSAIERTLKEHHPSNALSIRISQIHKFVNLPVDSIILTPSYETRDIHAFRTTSSYQYRREWVSEGNPHTIAVQHIKTLPRRAFPDRVQRALLAAKKTVTDFSKYESLISSVLIDGPAPKEQTGQHASAPDAEAEAVRTLRELLSSKDEKVRLQAAIALVGRHAP